MPFWHGDSLGRPAELGKALGGFIRELTRLDATEQHRQRVLNSRLRAAEIQSQVRAVLN